MGSPFPPVLRGLYIAVVIVWFVSERRQGAVRRPDATNADDGSRRVLWLSYLVGLVAAGLLHDHAAGSIDPANAARWAGLGALCIGAALRLWSFHALGEYFTFSVQTSGDQRVVASGPYRFVRHPGYLGLLLVFGGLGLALQNWWSLAALLLAVTFGLVNRIRVEERALRGAIGEPYVVYAATHKRLVPFVW